MRATGPTLALTLTAGLALATLTGCDPSGRCGDGEVCVFEDNSMRGAMQRFTDDDSSYESDDAVSSIANNTDSWVVFYVDHRQRGHALCVGPQAFVENLEDYEYDVFGHTFGDAFSSHELLAGRPRASSRGGPCDHTVTGDTVVGGGGWDRPPPSRC
jgi:hypothetical protein